MKIIDISHSIYNNMWAYKSEWANSVSEISSTSNGDASTIYKFEFYSHTGTYIETSQHKLNNNISLESFDLHSFICKIKLVVINSSCKEIKLQNFENELELCGIEVNDGDRLIICTGWTDINNCPKSFITEAPFFEEKLTNYLISKNLMLLGVDTPVIDNQSEPYNPVNMLFESNHNLLLLAPLAIKLNEVQSGTYLLSSLPLKITGASASLCRPVLIEL